MKKILVTGAAGFLGTHVCRRLLADGHVVIGLDNFSTGFKENLTSLLKHPSFSLIKHDITQPINIEVDCIVNLACPASPRWYQADPIQTTKTSFIGTLNLLELAHKLGATLLHASTSEVYGSPLEHPQREEYWGNVNPIGIRSCYDEGKRAAESLCFDFRRVYGTSVKVVRIFNTYGPLMGVADGRVVSTFVAQALKGEPLTMFGSGLQTRSFCYIDDLVDGLCRVLWSPEEVAGPLNLGNPYEVTLLELAQKILALTGSESKLVFDPLPQDDPPQRCPDITKIKALLGWSPVVSLEDGLARTIAHLKNELSEQQPLLCADKGIFKQGIL